jgi:hypothetical protein
LISGGGGTIAGNSDPPPGAKSVQIVRPRDLVRKVLNFRDHALLGRMILSEKIMLYSVA